MRYRFGFDLALLGHRAWLAAGLAVALAWVWFGAGNRLDRGFDPIDTEGAAMSVSRQILRGGTVSGEALTRVGPVAALIGSAVAGVNGGTVGHDDHRRAVLILSALTAMAAALWVFRLTFSVTAALAALVFTALPLGAQASRLGLGLEVSAALVAAALAALPEGGMASFLRALTAGLLLGLLIAQAPALALPLLLAVVSTSLFTLPDRAGAASAIGGVLLVAAAALTLSDRPAGLGLAVATGVLAIAWAVRQATPRSARFLGRRDLALLLGSALAWASVTLGVAVVIGLPAGALGFALARDFHWTAIDLPSSPTLLLSCALSLAVCASSTVGLRPARRFLAVARSTALAGLAAAAIFASLADRSLSVLALPWLWAVIGGEARPDPAPSIRSPRILLSLALTLCALSSATTPKALLACLGAVGAHDAIQRLRALAARRGAQPIWVGRLMAGATILALSIVALPAFQATRPTANEEPLGLPGAERLWVTHREAETYRELVARLEHVCDDVFVAPALDRWGYWVDPEKQLRILHSSSEPLDEPTQASVLARLRASQRPCVVRHTGADVDGRLWQDYAATSLGRGLVEWLPHVEVIDQGIELLRRR